MSKESNFYFICHVLIVSSNIFEESNATIFSGSLNRVNFVMFGKKLACERYGLVVGTVATVPQDRNPPFFATTSVYK